MPALGFQAWKAEKIECGLSSQTIRAQRKDGRRPCRVGDRLTFYRGLRTRACRKIGEGVCTFCLPIQIDDGDRVRVAGKLPYSACAHSIARADGFATTAEMVEWFRDTHGLPFVGWVIGWKPTQRERE